MTEDGLVLEILGQNGGLRAIIRETAEETGFTLHDFAGVSKKQPLARARQLAMWRARRAGYSLEAIGRVLNRHHTTVIRGVENIDEILQGDPAI